jgi:hypothetical protein
MHSSIFIFLKLLLPVHKADHNTIKRFEEFDDPYDDIKMEFLLFKRGTVLKRSFGTSCYLNSKHLTRHYLHPKQTRKMLPIAFYDGPTVLKKSWTLRHPS